MSSVILQWDTTAVKGPLFSEWSWWEYSHACSDHCHGFLITTNFDLPDLFTFRFLFCLFVCLSVCLFLIQVPALLLTALVEANSAWSPCSSSQPIVAGPRVMSARRTETGSKSTTICSSLIWIYIEHITVWGVPPLKMSAVDQVKCRPNYRDVLVVPWTGRVSDGLVSRAVIQLFLMIWWPCPEVV